LVAAWDRAGHDIGNHSYSHLYFNANGAANSDDTNVTLAEFEADALKNESLIRSYSHFVRLFRYPYFKEGDTVQKRDGMRSFLLEHGYRIGRATVDASDWAISTRLEDRAKGNPKADLTVTAISSSSTSGNVLNSMMRLLAEFSITRCDILFCCIITPSTHYSSIN
jgi:peptidoglycan-N-acetylglucosamine deacetylase